MRGMVKRSRPPKPGPRASVVRALDDIKHEVHGINLAIHRIAHVLEQGPAVTLTPRITFDPPENK